MLSIQLTLSGASRCELAGSAANININASGASQINAPDFQLQNTDIVLSGASHAAINTAGTLNVELTGASSLDYSGSPSMGKVNVSGASSLNKK